MSLLRFTGERIVPGASNCEPLFANKMYQEHITRYLFVAQVCKGKNVLDVGYGSKMLARKGAKSVTAFDISPKSIDHAALYYADDSVSFHIASAEKFTFKRKFDVIVCFELIEHVEAQEEVIKRIYRHLKETGILIISTPRALEKKRGVFHASEFSLNRFKSFLGKYFNHVKLLFENNHYMSLVTDGKPGALKKIYALNDQFHLDKADYFLAVVSRKPIDKKRFSSQAVINNEEYVKLREKNVEILRHDL